MEPFYWNSYALGFLISGILFFLFGLYVIKQAPSSPLHLSFFAISVNCSIWLVSTFFLLSSRTPFWAELSYKALYLGLSFVFVSIYAYSSVLMGYAGKQKRRIVIGYVLAGIFTLLIWTTPWVVKGYQQWTWGNYSRLTVLGGSCYLVFFAVYMLFLFRNFWRSYRQATTPVLKRQSKFVLAGFFIAYIATIDFLPCYGIDVFPIGAFTTLFLLTALGYSVIRYKLFDIETVIHRTIMWLFTSAIAVLPFAGIVYSTQPLMRGRGAMETTVYFLVFALVFYFYFRSLQPFLDQLFQRQRKNLEAILGRFSRELVHLKDLRDLLQSFAKMLRRELLVRRLSVYLFDEERNEYTAVIAKGVRRLKPFPAGHPFLKWLERADAVVAGELLAMDPAVEKIKIEIAECFEATQSFVAIPFVLSGKLIGMAFLGKKATLKPYRFSEVRFLTQLKAPVTIAFSNSTRFEDIRELSEELRRWNEELEKRVEERTRELVKTQEQLIQAEKLATLGTLAGGVAHEINNPLTAVLTNAQILRMSARESDFDSISLIEEGAKRCQLIVQKLMKYARKTDEEAPFKSVSLNDVVKSTLNLIEFQFKQENIEVVTDLGEVPLIEGISNELEQVFTNLLVNARDAVTAAKKQGKITVRTQVSGKAVELSVRDNGIGIAKENLSKIFDPFFTTKDVGAGTGLGLAVSLGILKRHHAIITADSEPNKGTTFIVKFPKPKT